MSDKKSLIEKFENLKNQYKIAFKEKLFDLCRKIGDELFEIVEQLRALGMENKDMGLSADGQYIIRSFEMVARDPVSPNADAIFEDAKRCANGVCEGTKRFTMVGMEIVQKNPDGTTQFPDPEPEENEQPRSKLIPPPMTRNADFISETYPEICSLECEHKTCSSYNTAQVGKRCRNRPLTNQELFGKQPTGDE